MATGRIMSIEIKHRDGSVLYVAGRAQDVRAALEQAVREGAYLRGADLGGADLRGADLRGAYLRGADLRGAYLRGANLRGANLAYADLGGANLRDADLGGANLRGAYLRGANLGGAYLADADLAYANLADANLRGADLRGADLGGANLRGADLRGANLRGAYLRGADLRGAYLRGANLADADLRGANLRGANLRGAKGINRYMTSPLYMLLDQPGKIRAYKLVNANGEGPYNGGIVYETGETYKVTDADTTDAHCAVGINLASLDWCIREWRPGYRILLAEFTAKDIASIPVGTDGKFRVRKCRIVRELDLATVGLDDTTEEGT